MRKRPRFTILVGVVGTNIAIFIVHFQKKREYLDTKQIENPCGGHENLSSRHVNTHTKLFVE